MPSHPYSLQRSNEVSLALGSRAVCVSCVFSSEMVYPMMVASLRNFMYSQTMSVGKMVLDFQLTVVTLFLCRNASYKGVVLLIALKSKHRHAG